MIKSSDAPSAGNKGDNTPHIFHVIPSFAHGGVPIRISYLMNHFGPKARHSLLATGGDYDCRSRLTENVDFTITDIGAADSGNLLQRVINYRAVLRKMKPDLLLTYNWGSTEWALANCFGPVCRHFHLESGFGPEEATATIRRRNWFRRLALRNIEAIIVPSQNLVNISRTDWKIPERKIRYIPNGVDCAKYAAAPQEGIIPGFVKRPGDIVIGAMTPLRPEKNLPRLIRAFHEVRQNRPACNLRLIIMGEGNERPKLERMVSALNLQGQIYLPGHIEHPERALGWLDLYAISSDTEQMPNSLNQALAAGLPIAGLDVGDVKFMMPPENKEFIVEAGNDSAFVQVLTRLVDDENLRREIGLINQKHVRETFDQQHMFGAYARVWGVME